MTEPVFLIGLGILSTATVVIVRTIAGAVTASNGSQSELAQLREQVDQQAVALEDAESSLANQATLLAELHDRVEFTERLMVQSRDRDALGPGEKRDGA